MLLLRKITWEENIVFRSKILSGRGKQKNDTAAFKKAPIRNNKQRNMNS